MCTQQRNNQPSGRRTVGRRSEDKVNTTDYMTVTVMVAGIEEAMFKLEDYYEGMEDEQRQADISELLDALYASVAEVRLMLNRWSDEIGDPF